MIEVQVMIQGRVDWKERVGRWGDGDGETGRGAMGRGAMGRGRWRSGEGRGRWTRRSGMGWGDRRGAIGRRLGWDEGGGGRLRGAT